MEVTCDQAMPLIAAHAEGGLADAKQDTLQRHLASCEPCSETLAALTDDDDEHALATEPSATDPSATDDVQWIARFPTGSLEPLASAPTVTPASDLPSAMDATMPVATDTTLPAPAVVPERSATSVLPEVNPAVYTRENKVGAGGGGQITRARDRRLGRVVALKELLHDSGTERFVHEAHVTARLQHPAIVPVHEAGQWPSGEPFFAMKLIEGRSLAKEIKRRDSLDERIELVPNMITMAEAIAYAHSQGVVHRDLKPLNVMIGPYGETVVIDWGLAKFIGEDDQTFKGRSLRTSEVRDGATMFGVGTPHYMPKEQALGEEPDERTDVYALGATLYHILAGNPPHWQPSDDTLDRDKVIDRMLEIRDKVGTQPPRPLVEIVPRAPAELLAIVDRAMQFEPAGRYPSAKEFAEELRRFQTGQLVASYSYSRLDRFKRWLKRHQGAVTASAILLTVLAIFAVVSVREIVHQRDQARTALVQVKKARAIADDRAERLLISSARSALDTDPTAALAWLKRYPWTKAPTRAARVIAADAHSRGVAMFVSRAHARRVTGLAIDANANTVVTASEDRTVRIFDVAGRMSHVLRHHAHVVYDVAVSRDGTVVVSAGEDGHVFVRRGAAAAQKLGRHPGGATAVAVTNRGDRLASGGADGRVLLYAGGDTKTIASHTGAVTHVGFSSDGTTLVAAYRDESVRVITIATGDTWTLPQKHQNEAPPVFANAGAMLVTVDTDNSLRVWNVAERTSLALKHHKEAVSGVAVSNGGKLLWSTGWDGDLRRTDLATKQSEVVVHSPDELLSLAVSADGKTIVAGGADRIVYSYDTEAKIVRPLHGHRDELVAVAIAAKGHQLVSVSKNGGLRIWRANEQKRQRKLATHTRAVRRLQLSGDSRSLLSASMSEFIVHDLAKGTHAQFEAGEGYAGSFSPDGSLVALASDAGRINVVDRATLKPTRTFAVAGLVRHLAFSPKGDLLAACGDDGLVSLYRLGPTRDKARMLRGHKGTVQWVEFSPDGARLVTAGADRSVRVWSVASGSQQHMHRAHTRDALVASFSSDGSRIVSAGRDNQPRLWQPGQPPIALRGHTSTAPLARFVPGTNRIISASADSTIRSWNADGTPRRVYRGHTDALTHIAVATADNTLLSTSQDQSVRLWDMTTAESRSLHHNATQPFNHAVISADAKRIAAGSEQGVVWLWQAPLPGDDQMVTWLAEQTTVSVDPATGAID